MWAWVVPRRAAGRMAVPDAPSARCSGAHQLDIRLVNGRWDCNACRNVGPTTFRYLRRAPHDSIGGRSRGGRGVAPGARLGGGPRRAAAGRGGPRRAVRGGGSAEATTVRPLLRSASTRHSPRERSLGLRIPSECRTDHVQMLQSRASRQHRRLAGPSRVAAAPGAARQQRCGPAAAVRPATARWVGSSSNRDKCSPGEH
jgi:hypothetical protein